jgi:large subunit ribosomal protein L46
MFFRVASSSCRRQPKGGHRSLTGSSLPVLTTAVILNRSPILTRTPTPFERAFYKYQARIQRALHNPFPFDFYFKQGSLLESRFRIEERTRERKAFGRSSSTKEDEAGPTLQQLGPQEGEGEIVMPRKHESDLKIDVKSLDRRGSRNLYLLLKTKDGEKEVWRFPQGIVQRGALLHQVGRNVH